MTAGRRGTTILALVPARLQAILSDNLVRLPRRDHYAATAGEVPEPGDAQAG